jgi:HSP20 family protein
MKRNKTPARRQEVGGLFGLQHEMNRLFDEFFGSADMPDRWWPGSLLERQERALGDFVPRVNVSETDKELLISAEVPGMDEKDVKVELEDDVLVLRGERKHESEDKKGDWHQVEYSYGSFHRAIPLPASVDSAKARAKFSKGVLQVEIPKKKEDPSRRKLVEITSE